MNTPSVPSTAYQIGYVFGMVIAVIVFLAAIALAVYAIVQAFRKKTRGWIVGGVVGGLFLLVPAVLMIAAMANGFVQGYRQAIAQRSTGNHSQTIRGQNLEYSIEAPPEWTIKRKVQDYDVMMSHRSIYLGVIAEELNLGSAEVVANFARNRIKEIGSDIHWSDPKLLILDGRNWLEFSVDCKVKDVPLSYQFYTYAGEEGTYQIIGWTTQPLAEKYRAEMTNTMQTFRFPVTNSISL